MPLSKSQLQALTKIRASGGSDIDSTLDESICCYLLTVLARDLNITKDFPEIAVNLGGIFSPNPEKLRLKGLDFLEIYERVLAKVADADGYFLCLAKLHKARLKYSRILMAQPLPTADQVGPRGLLQYGSMGTPALAAFLFWRKWMFDIDNRAGQETGYLFEPIIAHCIGGVAFGAKNSPIKRLGEKAGGRQVDCLREEIKAAYEVKIRVTIAASGQGRWGEELSFPTEVAASGYKPVLLVLDPTSNAKLIELTGAFHEAKGDVYLGEAAWAHLESAAGKTMARFLDKYVKEPIADILDSSGQCLPDLTLHSEMGKIRITVGDEKIEIARKESLILATGVDVIPDDTDSGLSA
ncbi:hypothetical protein SAMN05421770_105210 [Granulicella rosea]|uniref:Uncharacterized protein n=1 Tax=Granulicella rosea TaxID=474952 RepID=A0A239KV42_9BACT|nr:hypothetical protein [Granulicella rosea]SNT21622.1 hypothetical protein SAMN05421770_105210 [Granulicella rosea]